MNSTMTKQLMLFFTVFVGAGVTSWAVNNLPWISEQDPKWKTAIQLGGGLALVFLTPGSWQLAKVAGVGAAVIGGAGAIEKFSGGKIKMLAGPGNGKNRALTPQELNALRALGNMRAPATLSRPASTMRAPASVMHGNKFDASWARGGYGGGAW
jgi:hypothetical protein